MTKQELDYYLSNGRFAVEFLENLSNNGKGRAECNSAYNHALTVQHLVNYVELLFNLNQRLEGVISDQRKEIEELKQGEFNTLLAKEKDKLTVNFECIKQDLIEYIKAYPDLDD